jgi:hypothetical protein
MAFSDASLGATRQPRHRFSLLLLDEGACACACRCCLGAVPDTTPSRHPPAGEDYVCDWVAFCMPPPGKLDVSGGAGVRGRLRLCSLSLVFDPDDQRLPILKLPFAKVEQLDKDDGVEGALSVTATQWLRMKASGVDSPYVNDKSGPATWRFSLAFAKLSALLVRAHSCSVDSLAECCCCTLTALSASAGPGQAAAGHVSAASLRAPGRPQGGCPGAGGCRHLRRLPPG